MFSSHGKACCLVLNKGSNYLFYAPNITDQSIGVTSSLTVAILWRREAKNASQKKRTSACSTCSRIGIRHDKGYSQDYQRDHEHKIFELPRVHLRGHILF